MGARAGTGVPAEHRDLVALGPADPLASGLRDAAHHGLSVAVDGQRQPQAVPRGLDLVDRVEAGIAERRGVAGMPGRDLGVGGDDVDAVRHEV